MWTRVLLAFRPVVPCVLCGVLVPILASPDATAQTVFWTEWTSATISSTEGEAAGTLTLPDGSTVDVTYTGDVTFANINGEGPNYWIPEDPYISDDIPTSPASLMDLIAQSEGTSVTNTVTFSRPIEDALFAVVSLNNADHAFSLPIEVVSFGCGFWGCGELFVQDEMVLGSSGEGHGVVRIPGVVTSFSFQHTVPEFWTGFTIGIAGLAPVSTEPEVSATEAIGLLPTYPNPTHSRSQVVQPFQLRASDDVRVTLYDLIGREVAVVANASFSAGRHEVVVDVAELPSGSYVVRMETAHGISSARPITVIK